MARKARGEGDRAEAVARLLSGLACGEDLSELASAVEDLHPRNDTFPGEVFLHVAGDALDLAGVGRGQPIGYEGLLDQYLPEWQFRGREHRKIRFAVLATAAGRGGVEPDLLDEVIWWHSDDFWFYALAAAVAMIRACAERADESVPTFAERLATRIATA